MRVGEFPVVGGFYSGVEESAANTRVDTIIKGRNELERGIYRGSTPPRPLAIHYLIRSFSAPFLGDLGADDCFL